MERADSTQGLLAHALAIQNKREYPWQSFRFLLPGTWTGGSCKKSPHSSTFIGGRLETFLCFKFKCTKTYSCRGFESLFNTCVNMLYNQIWLGHTRKIYALLKWDPMFSPHRISLIHHHWKGLRPMMPATSWPLTWSGKVDRAIIFSTPVNTF